jgi:hypothetical protein
VKGTLYPRPIWYRYGIVTAYCASYLVRVQAVTVIKKLDVDVVGRNMLREFEIVAVKTAVIDPTVLKTVGAKVK